MKNLKRKVFVGLSGGVDSAVSAALLKKEAYDVTGVFIKAWTPPFDFAQGTRKQICGWKEDRRSAMRVAAVLDIPFITLDLEKEYKAEVVDYMIREYKEGKTPNPDVMCNKQIKFGHFLKFTLANGADFIATGHYTRAVASSQSRRDRDEVRVRLLEGKDKNKDQSYFLWTLTSDQLKHVLFPIGHLQKPAVRKLAEKFGLPQATRKDSQGLCFLGKVDMKEFLQKYIPQKRGDVLNEKGEKIGEHEGVVLYTIGERHGFSVNNRHAESEPLYIVAKNLKKNTLTVLPSPASRRFSRIGHTGVRGSLAQGERGEVKLQNTNWITEIPDKNLSCRIRYRQPKIGCRVEMKNNEVKVIFDKPQLGVSAGQSLVLYSGEICLGGGIITS